MELNVQANSVCKPCNEGWMNDLEIATRPYLVPMIESGLRSAFATEQQAVLAAWAVKTAMVAEFLKRRVGRVYFTPHERKVFMDTLIPPAHVHVWVAKYQGDYVCHLSASDLLTRGKDGDLAPAYCATFSLGQLAVQIFAYRTTAESQNFSVNRAPGGVRWEDNLILSLWPSDRDVALFWPLGIRSWTKPSTGWLGGSPSLATRRNAARTSRTAREVRRSPGFIGRCV